MYVFLYWCCKLLSLIKATFWMLYFFCCSVFMWAEWLVFLCSAPLQSLVCPVVVAQCHMVAGITALEKHCTITRVKFFQMLGVSYSFSESVNIQELKLSSNRDYYSFLELRFHGTQTYTFTAGSSFILTMFLFPKILLPLKILAQATNDFLVNIVKYFGGRPTYLL